MSASKPIAGESLLHPIALAAVLVLAVNDQWAKAHWPGVVTGKLSDFAGLLFFPLLLQAMWEFAQALLARSWRPSLRVLRAAVVATALVFCAVKVWWPASEAYRVALGVLRWPLDAAGASLRGAPVPRFARVSLTADATDLVALPALLCTLAIGRRRRTSVEA